ncbi:MAG: VTT domain-containing protein [Tepidisphaeraceae bacterium]
MKEFFNLLLNLLLHVGDDGAWRAMIDHIGATSLYVLMFAIIFVETGIVIAPFLPGDSLLFALGALGTQNIGINWQLAAGLLIVAAFLGDNTNYWIGRKLGPSIFSKEVDAVSHGAKPPLMARLLNKKHLAQTEAFFQRHGGKAVILGRFVVVVRTCMPFVAGMGRMNYAKFLTYSAIGAISWIGVCVGAGVLFGQTPFVKKHFELVIILIVAVTVVPAGLKILMHLIQARAEKKRALALTKEVETTSTSAH